MPRAKSWAVWCWLGICLAILWEPRPIGAFAQQTGAGGNEAASVPRASPVTIAHSQSSLNAAWQAVGPAQVASQSYGNVTGRVTAIAIDPADASGNTVYLGTTGGGVWKSINAAGPAASVTFSPLTDTLPVFSANAGTAAIPSLSIGAVSMSNASGTDVLLAGTGDPNDALDSYYGEGILRSADGGNTWTLIQQSNDGLAANHSFVGLSVAGFAWSSSTPGLVVAALSQSAEGLWSTRQTRPTASWASTTHRTRASPGRWGSSRTARQYVQRAATATYPGNAATAVVWNSVRQMFYAAVQYHGYYQSLRRHHMDAPDQPAGRGVDDDGVPYQPEWDWSPGVSHISRRACGTAGNRRHLRPHRGQQQSRPGFVSGCLRADGRNCTTGSMCSARS